MVDFDLVTVPVDSRAARFAPLEFPVRLFGVLPTWRGSLVRVVCRPDTSGQASVVRDWRVRQTEHPEEETWLLLLRDLRLA